MTARTRRVLALVILIAALAVVMSSDTLHSALLGVFEDAKVIILRYPVAGAVLFILLSALSAMVAFMSSAILIPVALVVWGRNLVFVFLWVGWILGGVCSYLLARHLGRPAVTRLFSRNAVTRTEAWAGPQTGFGLVLLFQLAVPSEIPGFVLGLARYPLSRYLAALTIAELPFAIGAIYLGAGFLERRTLLLVAVGSAGLLLSLLALTALHRRIGGTD